MSKTEHDKTCILHCTDNDKVIDADVDRFEKGKFLEVFFLQNQMKMIWNGRVYVGNKMGYEFTTQGPKEYQINKGRGF